MLTDMNDKEFNYGDYVVYLRDDIPVLARITKIAINKKPRLVCFTSFNRKKWLVSLKRLKFIEIISKDKAKELFRDDYNIINGPWLNDSK